MIPKDGDAIRAALYDSDGLYAQDEQYLLRAIKDSDKEDYLRYYREDPLWAKYFDKPDLNPQRACGAISPTLG